MVPHRTRTLRNLRSTRDLRAELLSVAAELADMKLRTQAVAYAQAVRR